VRKHARLGALVIAGALTTMLAEAPAQAATNPYTPQEACNHQFGGSWSTTTDGHRSVTDQLGNKYGDVYLMYNGATGYNCVTTLKTSWVGTASPTVSYLWVQGDDEERVDSGKYKYYSAVQWHAAGRCVQYSGGIYSSDYSKGGEGFRNTWGNCG
jgi:hypothetical protein